MEPRGEMALIRCLEKSHNFQGRHSKLGRPYRESQGSSSAMFTLPSLPLLPFPGFSSRTKPHPQPEGAELADTVIVPGAESQVEEVGKEM